MLVLSAESAGFEAGNNATIKLNGVDVKMKVNENNNYRGLHVVVFDAFRGLLLHNQVYDTYRSSEKLEAWIEKNEKFAVGQAVVIACKDDCVTRLSGTVRYWLTKLGAKEIGSLKYR